MTERKLSEITPEQAKNREAFADYGRSRALMTNSEVAALRGSHERLLAWHKEFPQHHWNCKRSHNESFKCDCGFDDMLAEAEKLQ